MVKWILCSLVVGCTCLFMILYQHHSLEGSYMSLMKMEMKIIPLNMLSLAVGFKRIPCGMTLQSTFPPLCSSLSVPSAHQLEVEVHTLLQPCCTGGICAYNQSVLKAEYLVQ